MSQRKNTIIVSEIENFFSGNCGKAINGIINVIKALKFTDRHLGLQTKCNASRSTTDKLLTMIQFPLFGVKDPWSYCFGQASRLIDAGKDQFYRLLNEATINWRNVNYVIVNGLLALISKRAETTDPICLIVDDTDLPKRGICMEFISRIYSHVTHTYKLGFKMLALALDDGKQMSCVDFSLHGEKGRNNNYGLTDKQLKCRKKVRHSAKNPDSERIAEYSMSKTDTLIGMIRRFVQRGHRADYLLADSWFACDKLLKFVRRLKCGMHYLGMAKLNDTKYDINGKDLSARQLSKQKRKQTRCRSLNCRYFVVRAIYKGLDVQLFFVRLGKCKTWRILITTDLDLDFEKAYRLYARRWNIEVFFKECKQHLNLGGCQSHSFNAQIAATTICMIQYNLLATAKRFGCYETFGELFRAAGIEATETTLSKRILLVIQEIIIDLADFLETDADVLIKKYICDNESFRKHFNLQTLGAA